MSLKKPFKLVYQGTTITRIFSVDSEVCQALKTVRAHFKVPEETELKISFKGTELDVLETFQEAGIIGGELLITPLNQISEEEKLMIFISLEQADPIEWPTSLSKRVKEVKNDFCEALEVDPKIYSFTIDDVEINEDRILKDIPQLEEVVCIIQKIVDAPRKDVPTDYIFDFKFKLKIQENISDLVQRLDPQLTINILTKQLEACTSIKSANQIWSLDDDGEELHGETTLLSAMKGDLNHLIWIRERTSFIHKQIIQEIKLYKFTYQNGKSIPKQFSAHEKISTVVKVVKKAFKITDNIEIILQYDGRTLDSSKSLFEAVENHENEIVVLRKEDAINLVEVSFINNGDGEIFKVSVPSSQTIREIKENLCKNLKIENSYLFSLTLDNDIVEDSRKLIDLQDSVKFSVFDLQPSVMMTFILEENTRITQKTIASSTTGKITDLKSFLLREGITKSNRFRLFYPGRFISEQGWH